MVKEAVKASLHIMQFTDTWGVPNQKNMDFFVTKVGIPQKNSSESRVRY